MVDRNDSIIALSTEIATRPIERGGPPLRKRRPKIHEVKWITIATIISVTREIDSQYPVRSAREVETALGGTDGCTTVVRHHSPAASEFISRDAEWLENELSK
jgi:hypothetical protein